MELNNKRVLVVGMARSGIACARMLAQKGAVVIANDSKSRDQLEGLEDLQDVSVQWALEQPAQPLVDGCDLVVISPGVPIQSAFIAAAKEKGIPVIGELELAAAFCRAPIVAITGTNGKTTTTALTGAIFKAAGRKAFVAGNIGTPLTLVAQQAQPEDIVIAEVSSFQLESIDAFHPVSAAILNLTQDHLNRHHTMEEYARMKTRIFENQTGEDWAVLPYADEATRALADGTKARKVYFSLEKMDELGAYVDMDKIMLHIDEGNPCPVCRVDEVRILGRHNLENALAATALAATQGVDAKAIAKTLKSFAGMEHRFELVTEFNQIRFINDSKATNPDSTIKGLEGMTTPCVPILGGYDKQLPFDTLIASIVANPLITAVVTMGATSDTIYTGLVAAGYTHAIKARGLEGAVQTAMRLCQPGGAVVFTPACASFDMFDNYEQRGRAFKEVVHQLGAENR